MQRRPVRAGVQATWWKPFGHNVKSNAEVVASDCRKPADAQAHRVRRPGLIKVAGHHGRAKRRFRTGDAVRGVELAEVLVAEDREIGILSPRAPAAGALAVFDLAHVVGTPGHCHDRAGMRVLGWGIQRAYASGIVRSRNAAFLAWFRNVFIAAPPHKTTLRTSISGREDNAASVCRGTVLKGVRQTGLTAEPARACLPNIGVLISEYRLVTRVGVISEEFWAAVESVMPSDEGKRGNRFSDHRLMLEGIAWRFRTGCPWRDLPTDFGPWQTVWKRHHRWSLDGTYDDMFAQVAAVFGVDAETAGDIEKLLSVDSTSARAHQHCAGARSDTLATGGSVELQESRR